MCMCAFEMQHNNNNSSSHLRTVRFAVCNDDYVVLHSTAVTFLTLKHHLAYVPAMMCQNEAQCLQQSRDRCIHAWTVPSPV